MDKWTEEELYSAWKAGQPPAAASVSSSPWSEQELKSAWEAEQDPERLLNVGRSLAKGAGSLLGFATDVASLPNNISRSIASWLTDGPETNFTQGSESIDELRRSLVEEPVARDMLQRYLNAGSEMLPTIAIPGGGLALRTASALGAGVGGEVAKELDAPEWAGQVVGGITPGALKSAGRAAAAPFRNIGQSIETQSDDVIRALIGEEELRRIAKNLETAKETPFTQYMRTAEVARSPKLAAVTRAIELDDIKGVGKIGAKEIGAKEIGRQLDEAREIARRNLLASTQGVQRTPEKAGEVIRGALEEAKLNIAGRVVDAAESAKATKNLVNIFPLKKSVSDDAVTAAKKLLPLDKEGLAVVNAFRKGTPNKLTVEEFLSTRQLIGDALGSYKSGIAPLSPTQKTSKRVLSKLYSGLKELPAGSTLPRKAVKSIEKMDSLRKLQGQLFEEQTTGKLLRKIGPSNTYKVVNSKVLGKVLETPESARQVFNAIKQKSLNGELPADFGNGLEAIRNGLLEDLIDRSTSKLTGQFSPGAFSANWAKMRNVATEVMTKDQIKAVGVVRSDLISRNRLNTITTAASASGSQTAELLSSVNEIRTAVANGIRPLLGSAAKGLPIVGTIAEKVIEKRIAQVQSLVDEKLLQLAFNRKLAPGLLKDATPKQIKDASDFVLAKVAAAIVAGQDEDYNEEPKKKMTKPLSMPESTTRAVQKAEQAGNSAVESGIDMDRLVRAMTLKESNNNPNAIGYETPMTRKLGERAIGLMQILPSTAADIAKQLGVKEYDLKDPETNLRFGRQYITNLIKEFDGDVPLALTAYHTGIGKVKELLKATRGRKLEDIIERLGPAGRRYAAEIMQAYRTQEV